MRKSATPKLYVSVDCVVFGYSERQLYLPLFRRRDDGRDPFPGCWSLAGGPLQAGERFEDSCRRKLEEDIGLKVEFLEQLYTFDDPARDPRDRAISVSYYALIRWTDAPLRCGPEASEAKWFAWDELPTGPYAFDHKLIIDKAAERLRGKIQYQPIGLNLLDDEFSLPDLQAIYDTVLGRELDRRNFSKKLLSYDLLQPTRLIRKGRGRPTQLYRFNREIYQRLQAGGFSIGC